LSVSTILGCGDGSGLLRLFAWCRFETAHTA
jgi:hypothetical protein